MPLPVAHGLLGASIVAVIHPRPKKRRLLPLLIGAVLANAADLDFLLVFILRSKSWHRAFSHSIPMALIVCLICALSFGKGRIREAAAYGLAYASHGMLDYLTTKRGGGVELLWPFSAERFAFGWVGLSEIPSRLPLMEVFKSLGLELMLFMPLLLLVLSLRKAAAKETGVS